MIGTRRLSSQGVLCLAIFTAIAWDAAPAIADDRESVTLIDLSPDDVVEHEIAHDVRRALRANAKLRYRDPDESLNVGAEDADITNVRSGRSFLMAGRKALDAGDFAQAAEDFESAATTYLSSFSHATEDDPIEEAILLQGVALLSMGNADRGYKTLVRGVEFRPRYVMDLSKFSEAIQGKYRKAREEWALRPDVTFEVRTSVPNADVWVNGRYFGLSPAFVKSAVGPQFVRVSKHGYGRVGRLQQITGPDVIVPFELKAARRKPAWDALRVKLAEVFEGAVEPNDLSAAQGLLNANVAVVLQSSGTREKVHVRLALSNLASRQVLKRVEREISWLKRDKATIDALVTDLFATPELPKGHDKPTVRTETVLHKWWFWALVGGVVAGSVTAAVMLGDSEPAPPKYAAGTGGLVIKF